MGPVELRNVATRITKYAATLLHSAYTVYILYTLGKVLITPEKHLSFEFYLVLSGLILLLIVNSCLMIYVTYTLGAKSRYSEAPIPLHQCIHQIRDTYVYLSNCLKEEDLSLFEVSKLKSELTHAMSSLQTAFTITSTVNTRVCIKSIGRDSESQTFYVNTLARDSSSAKAREEKDTNEQKQHTIDGNSDFNRLFRGLDNYYFNGQLWKDQSYDNTRDLYKDATNKGKMKRRDYNSTIVWPIRMRDDNNQITVLGFLAVDALPDNVFDERYDVQMGAAVADALYMLLLQYRQIKHRMEMLKSDENTKKD